MADRPTAGEIEGMRRRYGRWIERDRRISRLAFESRLERTAGNARGGLPDDTTASPDGRI